MNCLTHSSPEGQRDYFAALSPGSDVDLRGTEISEALFTRLRNALTNESGEPQFGRASFRQARFLGSIDFGEFTFNGVTSFNESHFEEGVDFTGSKFIGMATFNSAHFSRGARFEATEFDSFTGFDLARFDLHSTFLQVHFSHITTFKGVIFDGAVGFEYARFDEGVSFDQACFASTASFAQAEFGNDTQFTRANFGDLYAPSAKFHAAVDFNRSNVHGTATFRGASFGGRSSIGPLSCGEHLILADAAFLSSSLIEVMAERVSCVRSRFEESATLRISYATVFLDQAAFLQPSTITSDVPNVPRPSGTERAGDGDPTAASISSLRGVDASMLLLSSVDISTCGFSGTHHLDQLRLEGIWRIQRPPSGIRWRRGLPRRWTKRQVIFEERQWRGWVAHNTFPDLLPGPAIIATSYRQLRKAREDAKDEPGAADFYYGEMEMRRHSKRWNTAERWLLQLYWLLSGYGLRASRALVWLALAMGVTIWAMMLWGLPQDSPKQEATGVVPPGGGKVTFEIHKDDPQNPTGDHFSGERFDKALSVTFNSVVFRSSGEELTTAGGYIEMVSRFSEPVLLGLAALAIRGRVKR
ncbi:pentapeptide repeat-containing protein [Streptomyces sp. NPDC095817]|uniref:pentapeptide repeat-containing protein n=1 Tax=Streptomyces sp. NPDC095817 TaxID=3155082 RepID=UPI00331C0A1A